METTVLERTEETLLANPLESVRTADQSYEAVSTAAPEAADFSHKRRCGHWRS